MSVEAGLNLQFFNLLPERLREGQSWIYETRNKNKY